MEALAVADAPIARRHGNPANLSALRDAPDEMLLTMAELGALTNHAVVTIRLWHREGRGPRRIMVEGRPRYKLADVRAWLAGGSR